MARNMRPRNHYILHVNTFTAFQHYYGVLIRKIKTVKILRHNDEDQMESNEETENNVQLATQEAQ